MAKRAKQPLGITCTSTNCESGLHCFRQAKKRGEGRVVGGHCRDCGVDLVDWPRVNKRDLRDVEYTFRSLKYELIRHHFWHQELDIQAVNYARRKGLNGLEVRGEKRVRQALGVADSDISTAARRERAATHCSMPNMRARLVVGSVSNTGMGLSSTGPFLRKRCNTQTTANAVRQGPTAEPDTKWRARSCVAEGRR